MIILFPGSVLHFLQQQDLALVESQRAVGQGSAVGAAPGWNSELAVHCDTENLSQRDAEKMGYTSGFVPSASRTRCRIPKHLYPARRLCLCALIASNWLSGARPFPRAGTEVDNAFIKKAK